MSIKNKSETRKFFEKLRGGPLTFGHLIESLRLCDEISQVDLAKKMNISKSQICDIEKGRRLVSAERASAFAKAMGYSVQQFVATAIEDQLRQAGLKFKVDLKAA